MKTEEISIAKKDAPSLTETKQHTRKRRRKDKEEENVSPPKKKKKTTRSARPLNGMTVAVSSASQGAGDGNSSAGARYKQIVQLCKDAGATVTAQVHKKVRYVIATEAATDNSTQRVRKAWKKGIPVVTVAWIRQCIKEKKLVDVDAFLLQEKEVEVSLSTKKVTSRSNKPVDDLETIARTVDLGCCCACHEADAVDCPWCADCSVNSLEGPRP